jgi:hypothetical protein
LVAGRDDLPPVDGDARVCPAAGDDELAAVDLDRVARRQAMLGLLARADVDAPRPAPLLDRGRPGRLVAGIEAGDDENEDQDEDDDEARDRARVVLELVSSRGSYGWSRARP